MKSFARLPILLPLSWILSAALGACEGAPACGDGVLSSEEACDDGNGISGDGCNVSCELDDDQRTPGDDRAGYIWCATDPLGPGVTCSPGTRCCLTHLRCATAEEGCLDPLHVALCDGPEDCPGPDDHCQSLSHDRACRSEGINVFCHADADCRDVNEWLPDGVCTTGGVCDFGTRESGSRQ